MCRWVCYKLQSYHTICPGYDMIYSPLPHTLGKRFILYDYHQRWFQNSIIATVTAVNRLYLFSKYCKLWMKVFNSFNQYLYWRYSREKGGGVGFVHKRYPFVPTVMQNVLLIVPFFLESRRPGICVLNWIVELHYNHSYCQIIVYWIHLYCKITP